MVGIIHVANAACGWAAEPLLAAGRAAHIPHERKDCGCDLEVALGKAQHEDTSETLSLAEASFTTTNLLVKFAALSAPYILAQNGVAGIGVMCCAVGVCIFTGHLLADALEAIVYRGILRPTAGALAEEALGPIFGRFMQLMCPFECFIYCLGNTVCVVQALLVPFPDSDVGLNAFIFSGLVYLRICHPRGVMRLLALGVVGLGFALAVSMNAQFVLRSYNEYA